MTPGCCLGTINLQDAFHLVPVSRSHRKYLRFKAFGTTYKFNSLPFGLSSSPYVFTKLLKPVLNYLRFKGYTSVVYLDNFWCVGNDYLQCKNNIDFTITTLQSLGFPINFQKSSVIPSTRCLYLGLLADSNEFTISLPPSTKAKIRTQLQSFKKHKTIPIASFASLIGKLIFACYRVKYGLLHTRSLEREKIIALKRSHNNFNTFMQYTNRKGHSMVDFII